MECEATIYTLRPFRKMRAKGGEISSGYGRWRGARDTPLLKPESATYFSSASGWTVRKCKCDPYKMTENLVLNLDQPLDVRMNEFKNDPERMKEVNDFLDDVVEKARVEAESRQTKTKSKLDPLGLQSGGKKLGASIHKAKTSARTFASKVITVICNCTNTFKTVVTNRN